MMMAARALRALTMSGNLKKDHGPGPFARRKFVPLRFGGASWQCLYGLNGRYLECLGLDEC